MASTKLTLLISFGIFLLLATGCTREQSAPITGILGAMDVELVAFNDQVLSKQKLKLSGIDFTVGHLKGRKVVFAKTGVGKVNAAETATLLIEHFSPQEVIFTGIAGGLNPNLLPTDIIIGKKTVQHDLIILEADSYEPYAVRNPLNGKRNPIFFPADNRLLRLAKKARQHIKWPKTITDKGERLPMVTNGVIVTGDAFIASSAKRNDLHKRFQGDAVEMEGAAVAQICYQRGVPCLVVRGLSDRANEDVFEDFEKFHESAAHNSARLVVEIIGLLNSGGHTPDRREQ
jgi:adenosylhomocysteine nucleosidase